MEDAELYSRSSSLQQQFVSVVLRELWPALDWDCDEGVVLDVGCGAGEVTVEELVPRLPANVSVVASDLSPIMLTKAISRFAGPRLGFCQLDIGTPSIEDTVTWRLGPYHKIFSFFCLNWVPDQRVAMENISKLLCPGGEIILVIVSYTGVFTMYETLAESSRWSDYMEDYAQFITPYQHSDDPECELKTYLQEAGFSVKSCRNEKEISYVSMTEQRIIDTVTAINPFVSRFPVEKREAFMRDCVQEAYRNGALRRHRQPSGTAYAFYYDALVVHAVKD